MVLRLQGNTSGLFRDEYKLDTIFYKNEIFDWSIEQADIHHVVERLQGAET